MGAWSDFMLVSTHTHTHTQRERERERETHTHTYAHTYNLHIVWVRTNVKESVGVEVRGERPWFGLLWCLSSLPNLLL